MTAKGLAILDQEWQEAVDWAKENKGGVMWLHVLSQFEPDEFREWAASDDARDDLVRLMLQILQTATLELTERAFGENELCEPS